MAPSATARMLQVSIDMRNAPLHLLLMSLFQRQRRARAMANLAVCSLAAFALGCTWLAVSDSFCYAADKMAARHEAAALAGYVQLAELESNIRVTEIEVLEDLGFVGGTVDPWDRQFELRFDSTCDARSVCSSGRDGRSQTRDDICKVVDTGLSSGESRCVCVATQRYR